jgi:hypothetical protein
VKGLIHALAFELWVCCPRGLRVLRDDLIENVATPDRSRARRSVAQAAKARLRVILQRNCVRSHFVAI